MVNSKCIYKGVLEMNIFLSLIMPIIVGVGFVGFIFYQILGSKSQKTKKVSCSIMYFADSTNSGTRARQVFDVINELEPNYLGMKEYKL